MKTDVKYLVLSALAGLILQFGAILLVASFLVWFHQKAKSITSIIGLLTLIIGVAVAHMIAVRIHHYVVKDTFKRELSQKGNNFATLFLVLVVPIILFPYLDWIEQNLTQTIYYSITLVSFLIGIFICFFLNLIKLDQGSL